MTLCFLMYFFLFFLFSRLFTVKVTGFADHVLFVCCMFAAHFVCYFIFLSVPAQLIACTAKNCLWYEMKCVEWDVRHYLLMLVLML